MNRRDAIRHFAATGAALAFPALAQSARLVLGQSAAFTGPAAQLGIQLNKGARIFFDALNARGGINGLSVELRTLDDGYEPERCRANTEQLIKDDVFALFGYVGTPTCLAALPLVNAAKIPFFGPFVAWIPLIGWIAWLSMCIVNVIAITKTLKGEKWEIPFLGAYAKKINW